MAEFFEKVAKDPSTWTHISEGGLARIRERYTWCAARCRGAGSKCGAAACARPWLCPAVGLAQDYVGAEAMQC